MNTFIGLVKLHLWNFKLEISKCMQYRINFMIALIVSFGSSIIGPLFQYLLFTQTKGFPGWNFQQIILMQGMLLLWTGLKETLFGNVRWVSAGFVWNGDFDRILVKPYPAIGIILTSGVRFNSIATLVPGIILVWYSVTHMDISFGLPQAGLLLLSLVSGLLLFMATQILYSGIVIVLIQIGRIEDIFEHLYHFADYPIEIFPKIVRTLFITFIPLVVWVYVPTQVLLDRFELKMLVAAFSSVIFFLLSLRFWGYCMKKYTSAGG